MKKRGYYIVLISIHGLIRGENLELGRDADTGGQTLYVVQLARALAKHPNVERVDLLTRAVYDQKISEDYSKPYEDLGDDAQIVRLPCGPKRYLRKEALWPYLDGFIDQSIKHIRKIGQIPDVIHGHYGDAGYVGSSLASLLEVPFIFTGHSLGREKREKLLGKGLSQDEIDSKYNIETRIESEEFAISIASLIIASTKQEVDEQYKVYDNYFTKKMVIIPPGVNLDKFHADYDTQKDGEAVKIIEPFLRSLAKPLILAISRADERKNITTLVEVYGKSKELQERANLVLVLGNRDDINTLDSGAKKVLNSVIYLIDKYNLYGKVAYPKNHNRDDIASLYRLAAKKRGIFVNIALTEPFGLTLIESAASGLPIVATNDGGPRDIIKNLKNGILVDPLKKEDIESALLDILEDKRAWSGKRRAGLNAVEKFYSWESHAKKYIKEVEKLNIAEPQIHTFSIKPTQRLSLMKRLLICDIDNTLLGDDGALQDLVDKIKKHDSHLSFGVATGRNIDSAKKVLEEWGVPTPDIYISSVGSEIHFGKNMKEDRSWSRHIDYKWDRDGVLKALSGVKGVKLQSKVGQRRHKVSYIVDAKIAPKKREIQKILRNNNILGNIAYSHDEFLDILPIRASKGHAVRYIALKFGIPFSNILVAGDSGNDEDMLKGGTRAVIVGNYSRELAKLKGKVNIYFAETNYSAGILEGISYYDFFEDIKSV